jgi:DNA primase
VDYYLGLVTREEDLSTGQGKARAIERLTPLIIEVANPIERTHYIQALARNVQMDERLVAEQIRRGGVLEERQARAADAAAARRRVPVAPSLKRTAMPPAFTSEEYILGWLLLRPELLARLDEEMIAQQAPPLGPEDLSSAENQALLTGLLALSPSQGSETNAEDRLAEMPEPLRAGGQAAVNQVRLRPSLTDEKLIKDLGDSLLRLRLRHLYERIRRLEALVRESQEAGTEEWRQYTDTISMYNAQADHMQKVLHGRSTAGVLAQRKANVAANG